MTLEHEDVTLREAVATLKADHRALDRRVSGIEGEVGGLRKDLAGKHRENRQSIHDLRGGQQSIIDLIHKLDMKFAKFTGYAIGAGAVIGLILKVLDHLVK